MMKTKKQKQKNFESHNPTRGKTLSLLLLILCFYMQNINAQTVPANFFGINYWMPNQIPITSGSGYPGGFANCLTMQTLVKDAGVTFTRIGGGNSTDGYDFYGTAYAGTTPTTNDYIAAIKAVKDANPSGTLKFLIQIPFASGGFTFTAANAKTLVNAVKTFYSTDVFYYAIGNEWDRYIKPGSSPARAYYASELAALIKTYAIEMKSADPTIVIVAPALSYYAALDGNGQAFMPILLSGNGSASDITTVISGSAYGFLNGSKYYIDVVDFHTYAGGNNGDMSGISGNYSTYRTASIAYPSGGFTTDLGSLQTLLSNANTNNRTSPSSPLTYAVTELNINWKNPPLSSPTFPDENQNTPEGLGARSFFAGQYWADMFSAILKNGTLSTNAKVEFVNPWAINESNGDGSSFDLSMTKGTMTTCSDPAPQPLPTYWHYKLVAENCKGIFLPNKYTGNSAEYKAFAYNNTVTDELGVIIMNQHSQSPRGTDNSTKSFKINFNNLSPTGTYDMKFYFDSGVTVVGETNCTLTNETTMLLVFDTNTGILKKRETYSLQDAIRATDTGTFTNISTQGEYDGYVNDVRSDITIGTNSATTITAGYDKTFRATNSIQLNGPFSSGTQTLELLIDQTCP